MPADPNLLQSLTAIRNCLPNNAELALSQLNTLITQVDNASQPAANIWTLTTDHLKLILAQSYQGHDPDFLTDYPLPPSPFPLYTNDLIFNPPTFPIELPADADPSLQERFRFAQTLTEPDLELIADLAFDDWPIDTFWTIVANTFERYFKMEYRKSKPQQR